ncbi:MAG: hypothetical protein JWO67_305 [Streptosporangiaceae bacterium]|nr:hypothetical protein [Streptosporangiaceae bacterium]
MLVDQGFKNQVAAPGTLLGIDVETVRRTRRTRGSSRRKHDLHPIIDSRFDFDDVPVAFSKHRAGGVFGKVVIDVA